MARRIAVSMRVACSDYGEKRDALAQDWAIFMNAALPECFWLPFPNIGVLSRARTQLAGFGFDALILTGGEDWGASPERDATETTLFSWAMSNNYPVLGVCRGCQVINRLLGGGRAEVTGHRAVRHDVVLHSGGRISVNSYHNWGIPTKGLAPDLVVTAMADDESVEAFELPGRKIAGVMWHPEREESIKEFDRQMMLKLFGDD